MASRIISYPVHYCSWQGRILNMLRHGHTLTLTWPQFFAVAYMYMCIVVFCRCICCYGSTYCCLITSRACSNVAYIYTVSGKNGTNNILGITLTKFKKFPQLLAQCMLTFQLTTVASKFARFKPGRLQRVEHPTREGVQNTRH